jgi:hypothetical protein
MPPKLAEYLPCNDLANQITTYKARGFDCENTGSRRVYPRQEQGREIPGRTGRER